MRVLLVLTFWVMSMDAAIAARAAAQDQDAPGTGHSFITRDAERQQPRGIATRMGLLAQTRWPDPVADSGTFGYLLFDNAEFQQAGSSSAARWDILGWRGGDVHRFWVKSEGRTSTDIREGSEFEAQALYGRLIAPFFDLQAGVRVDQRVREGTDPTRVYAVLGLQGLSPYRFEIEPVLFISQKGQVSGRLTATYDVLFSQRLILQPRLETNVAVQRDEEIGIGGGWNDAEIGARLRYEMRREVAPYVGVTWKEGFGETHQLTTQQGRDHAHLAVVVGGRAWF